VKTLAITEKTGYVVAVEVVKDEDDLMIINKSGTTIRLHAEDIKLTKTRVAQGVKVIELKRRNDVISHLSVVPRADDEEVEQPADGEAPEDGQTPAPEAPVEN
jgi:DNA gyrase subunit A